MKHAAGHRAVLALALALGCSSHPSREEAIDALGGERQGVPAGPLHRPGQPCTFCHDGDGDPGSDFSLAGTILQTEGTTEPLVGAIVRMIDSSGREHDAATNCAGNFFVMRSDYDPVFPVWVKVRYGGIEQPMGSPIFREGSCAGCHGDRPGPDSPGPVTFAPAGIAFPPGCR